MSVHEDKAAEIAMELTRLALEKNIAFRTPGENQEYKLVASVMELGQAYQALYLAVRGNQMQEPSA